MPKRRDLRTLGRAIVRGTADDISDALDVVIAPESLMLEKLSDLVTLPIARVIVQGRAELVEGIREALDEAAG